MPEWEFLEIKLAQCCVWGRSASYHGLTATQHVLPAKLHQPAFFSIPPPKTICRDKQTGSNFLSKITIRKQTADLCWSHCGTKHTNTSCIATTVVQCVNNKQRTGITSRLQHNADIIRDRFFGRTSTDHLKDKWSYLWQFMNCQPWNTEWRFLQRISKLENTYSFPQNNLW